MSDEKDDWDVIPKEDLTWLENCYAWVGYGVCEIAFRSPDWAWEYLLYPSWCYSLGGWLYGKAFSRWCWNHYNEDWK